MSPNTLDTRANGGYSPDDIFKYIFLGETVLISIEVHWSLFLSSN